MTPRFVIIVGSPSHCSSEGLRLELYAAITPFLVWSGSQPVRRTVSDIECIPERVFVFTEVYEDLISSRIRLETDIRSCKPFFLFVMIYSADGVLNLKGQREAKP